MDNQHHHRFTQSERDRTRWVSGAGRYVTDIAAPGALTAVFLRSPHAHAEITRLDAAEASAMPGVVRIITGADCTAAGFGNFRALMRYGMNGPRPMVVPLRPVLAIDRVRYAGEAVACIIATGQAQALDAAEAVIVDYNPLPAVTWFGTDTATPPIYHEAPGNLALLHQAGDAPMVQAELASATHVVSTSVDLPRIAPVTMEPGGAIARYDAARETYHLITPHQGINEFRPDLAAVLNVPETRIMVDLPDVGGGFGARSPAYPEHAALLLAAKLTGAAIRWVPTRSETFLADCHGRSTRLTGKLGLDPDGRFTALEIAYATDLGAYVTTVGALVNVHNPLQSASGTYAIPALSVLFSQYFSNASPVGPYRGAGRPDIALLIERLVDLAATKLSADPLELRARNIIPANAFPYRTAAGSTYDNADYATLLNTAREVAAWQNSSSRRREAAQRNRLFGRGVALFAEIAGAGASANDQALVCLQVSEGRVHAVMETVSGGSGQSQAETYAFVLAPLLGLDPADIVLNASPAHSNLTGSGSIGSRSTQNAGSAIADAGAKIRAMLLAQAGLRANAPPEDLLIDAGRINRADGSLVMTIVQAVQAEGGSLSVVGSTPSSVSFPSGCHIAEIEIDRDTGTATLTRYIAVDDSGTILNPAVAEAQIHGGIVQGVGEVFSEAMRYDETGQPLTGSFMDYAMPRAADVPSFITLDRPTPSPNNPLGVKGLGEAGTTGALAAVTNAVANALAQIGAELPALPCTAERLWQAMQSGSGQK
ncbi:MAG: xanthine dehydrogenase [Rhodospirillales bacterium 20-64-7]|nr:MAG: xanthine dehydrogenase [Rhodospirillales bacterium 20-64-7]